MKYPNLLENITNPQRQDHKEEIVEAEANETKIERPPSCYACLGE